VIFFGILILLIIVVLFVDNKFGNDEILELNPSNVLKNIFITQLGFYALYLYVIFSINLIATETFWWTQAFSSLEFSFFTRRGLVSFFSLIIAMASLAIPLSATVHNSRNVSTFSWRYLVTMLTLQFYRWQTMSSLAFYCILWLFVLVIRTFQAMVAGGQLVVLDSFQA